MKIQNVEMLQKKITLFAALGAFFTGLIVAVVCLISMHAILKHHQDEKLGANLMIDAGVIDQYIGNAKETGLQIASRSVIRKKLEDYNAGVSDLKALREMSMPKIMDALKAAANVLAVRRFDARGRPVIDVGKKPYDRIGILSDIPAINRDIQKSGKDGQSISDLFSYNGKMYFTVTTPIKNSLNAPVGTDVLLVGFDDVDSLLAGNGTEAALRLLFLRKSGLFYDLAKKEFRTSDNGNIPRPVLLQIISTGLQEKDRVHLSATTVAGERLLLGERKLDNADWVMVCGFNEAKIYRSVYDNLIKIAIFLILIVLGAMYGTKRLLKPFTGAVIVETEELKKEIADRIADISALNETLRCEVKEKRAIEVILTKRESMLREAEKIAHLGHWELDLITGSLCWSEEIYRMFGLSGTDSQLSLDDFFSMVHPQERDAVRKAYNDSVEYNLPYDIVHRIVLPDGSVRYIHEQCVHERDETGKVTKSFGTALDVTEAKMVELLKIDEERRAMELKKKESLQNMAGAVAHLLNNMMTTIIMGIEMALPAAKGEDSKHLKMALQSSTRATQLGKLLLAYLGQFHRELVPVTLGQFWKDFQLSEFTSLPEGVALRYEIEADIPNIIGNGGLLAVLFKNLIENSMESMIGKRGVITVSCRSGYYTRDDICNQFSAVAPEDMVDGNYVLISIADEGAGIDHAHMEKLFDPFFSTKFTGRGLGLSVADGIVKTHNGLMKIDSEKGRGTIIKVIFKANGPNTGT